MSPFWKPWTPPTVKIETDCFRLKDKSYEFGCHLLEGYNRHLQMATSDAIFWKGEPSRHPASASGNDTKQQKIIIFLRTRIEAPANIFFKNTIWKWKYSSPLQRSLWGSLKPNQLCVIMLETTRYVVSGTRRWWLSHAMQHAPRGSMTIYLTPHCYILSSTGCWWRQAA